MSGGRPVALLIRRDDGGMSRSVNMALPRLVDSGIFFATSEALPDNHPELRPPSTADRLVALMRRMSAGVTRLVTHVSLDDAELARCST